MRETDKLRQCFAAHVPGLLGARHSYAVLCPLVEKADGLHLLYEVRSASLRRQPGEVCFPGGRMEPGETPVLCALRETEEELSIPTASVDILGTPDFICNQAGFLMQPVLGLVSAAGLAAMKPSSDEVAEAFSVPLSFFSKNLPQVYRYALEPHVPADFPYEAVGIPADYGWAEGRVQVPVWYWQGHAIWGMTARITEHIVDTLNKT